MTSAPAADPFRNRLLALIAAIIGVAALRASYPLTMPIVFAGVIVAALWPLKLWFDHWLPSWLSYLLTILVLAIVLFGFAAAVALSIGQVLGVLSSKWPALEGSYDAAREWIGRSGVPLNGAADKRRVLAFAGMLASTVYGVVTYVGFIGVLVLLGLPEVPRFHAKMQSEMASGSRKELSAMLVNASEQVRGYLGTTLATSVLTGVASLGWAWVTGLDLALVWGLLNFLLNFIPVIGNIIGIIPPTLYAVVQFGGYTMPLVVFVGFAALQIAISNFVYPYLQGRQLALSPLAIVVAMTFWSWVWGIAGALIAVPLTAATVIVCSHFPQTRWIATLLSA